MFRKLFLVTYLFLLSLKSFGDSITTAKDFLNDLIAFAEKQQNEKISDESLIAKIESYIDFNVFVEKSLGKRSRFIKQMDKKKFEALLMELIRLSAYPKAKQLLPFKNDVVIRSEGKMVFVTGKWFREKDGERVIRDFRMELIFNDKNKIMDSNFETHSLSENIARQIDKHMEKKPFSALLSQMKKKIETLKGKQVNS